MAATHERRGSRTQKRLAGREFRFHQQLNFQDSENMILAALPPKEQSYLRQHLEFVPLKFGDVLWEADQPIEFVYFPTSGMVSLLAVMRNGATAEVGVTGREGFVGTAVILGARDAPIRAVVQGEGGGFRIESKLLQHILHQTPQLEQMLRRYAHALSMQLAQAAACNCLHQIPERLARWLKMAYDRTGSDLLPVTQEFLAQMLGCRRASVTSALGRLQKAGVIHPGHGQLRILDPKQLEQRSCECYHVMKELSDLSRADQP
jgi:CRP-like cAMP-binding protein